MGHMSFADHVRAIMKEHGVSENKARMMMLHKNIPSIVSYCAERGIKPCIRFNLDRKFNPTHTQGKV
jgi:hypothetical protein